MRWKPAIDQQQKQQQNQRKHEFDQMEFSRSDRNFLKSLSFTYANRLSCVSVVGSMLPMGADKDRNIVNRD